MVRSLPRLPWYILFDVRSCVPARSLSSSALGFRLQTRVGIEAF